MHLQTDDKLFIFDPELCLYKLVFWMAYLMEELLEVWWNRTEIRTVNLPNRSFGYRAVRWARIESSAPDSLVHLSSWLCSMIREGFNHDSMRTSCWPVNQRSSTCKWVQIINIRVAVKVLAQKVSRAVSWLCKCELLSKRCSIILFCPD